MLLLRSAENMLLMLLLLFHAEWSVSECSDLLLAVRQRWTPSKKVSFWPLPLQVGVGGDHWAAHTGAYVRQPADGWVRMGPPAGCLHQANRWQPVVGAVWSQHLALLLLQRLHPAHSVAPAPGLRHHPSGQATDSETAHRWHQPPSCRRRESVSWQQPRT